MRRVLVIPFSLILITTAFSPVAVGAAGLIAAPAQQQQSIQILAVMASDAIRYNESLTVRILVGHRKYLLPEVSISTCL